MGKLFNLARMAAVTSGTGTLTMTAAVASYLTFASAGAATGDVITYAIVEGANREIGEGTLSVSAGHHTLGRAVIHDSTNGGAAITLAGAAEVFITCAAEDLTIGKQSIWIPAGAMTPRVTNGAGYGMFDSGTADITIRTLDFESVTQEFAHFQIAMPVSWNEGTITAKFFATATTITAATTVVFTLAGTAARDGTSLNNAVGTAVSITYTPSTALDLHITAETAALTIANSPAAGDMVNFELSRDVSADSAVSDAMLLGCMLYINTIRGTDA